MECSLAFVRFREQHHHSRPHIYLSEKTQSHFSSCHSYYREKFVIEFALLVLRLICGIHHPESNHSHYAFINTSLVQKVNKCIHGLHLVRLYKEDFGSVLIEP